MNNIASERQSLGLTQEQLALMFGWRQSRISNYENGTRKPNLSDCRRIVEKFGVDVWVAPIAHLEL
nr:MAG TPA: Helix-turn-helix XRE-family like protein [Caudoviricetes sp.]